VNTSGASAVNTSDAGVNTSDAGVNGAFGVNWASNAGASGVNWVPVVKRAPADRQRVEPSGGVAADLGAVRVLRTAHGKRKQKTNVSLNT